MEEALVKFERFKHLDLSARGLKDFPEGINELINLDYLNLSENFIFEWDANFLQLPNLRSINFSNNPGIITLELFGADTLLPSLEELDISSCKLSMLTPAIEDLPRVKKLYLADNDLTFMSDVILHLA